MTTEQLDYILKLDSKKEIKNQLKEWFGVKELEVGKWYKRDSELLVWNDENITYGIDSRGEFRNDLYFSVTVDCFEATDKEVEAALTKEAIKRGFVDADICILLEDKKYKLEKQKGCFQLLGSILFYQGAPIFHDGKWAEVIQTITKEEAEKQLGKIIV